jgi:predicted nucleotidyltransferase
VRLLDRLGFVDSISFGAENPELKQLSQVADALDSQDVIHAQKKLMRTGPSYAAALSETLAARNVVEKEFIRSPNNILGAEYIRAIKSYAPSIRTLPVLRTGSAYHSTIIQGPISSAGAIRRALTEEAPDMDFISKTIPEVAWKELTRALSNGWGTPDISRIDALVLHLIRSSTNSMLQMNPEISEGLENRIIRAALQVSSIRDLMDALSCKRYPRSRFRRLLIHLLLGTTRESISKFDHSGPLYARILCSGEKGQTALKYLRKHSQIPLINKLSRHIRSSDLHNSCLTPLQEMLSFDVRGTDLFCLMLPSPKKRVGGTDFLRSPGSLGQNNR